jgi:hypothetical protein
MSACESRTSPDIKNLPGSTGALGREEVGVNYVIDEGEVAGLQAIAVDHGTLATQCRGDESRDDSCVL